MSIVKLGLKGIFRPIVIRFLKPILFTYNYLFFRIRYSLKNRAHTSKINELKTRDNFRVAFIMLLDGNWKYDSLYQALKGDSKFKPIVVICPFITYGMSRAMEELEKSQALCQEKDYDYYMTWNSDSSTWSDFKIDISPDIVFFSTPHKHSLSIYSIEHFKDVLSCYVPYSIRTDHLIELQFNQYFHQLVWINFYETDIHAKIARQHSFNKGDNVVVSGYPTLDLLNMDNSLVSSTSGPKIIWAPHWTIPKTDLNRSCFLEFHEYFINLPRRFSDIEVVFRPHPLLKETLYKLEEWGKSKTDEYFEIWENNPKLSISEGDYIADFKSSTLLVHDSVSFLAEYLVTDKPAIFTKRVNDIDPPFNEFGQICLEAHYICRTPAELDILVNELVYEKKDPKQMDRKAVVEKYLVDSDMAVSDKILSILRRRLNSESTYNE